MSCKQSGVAVLTLVRFPKLFSSMQKIDVFCVFLFSFSLLHVKNTVRISYVQSIAKCDSHRKQRENKEEKNPLIVGASPELALQESHVIRVVLVLLVVSSRLAISVSLRREILLFFLTSLDTRAYHIPSPVDPINFYVPTKI